MIYWNPHDRIVRASNKLLAFQELAKNDEINLPAFTDRLDVATEWLASGNTALVVCRRVLSGHSGAGIVLASKVDELVQAPLYTQYVKKRKEFRVHVAFGSVIDVQEKRIRKDFEGQSDKQIRNYHNGWVYCREEIQEPTDLRQMALASISQLGLDFGAVDIIWNEHSNKSYVLEVNTAPGLEGTTVEKYGNAFLEQMKNERAYQ
ncbi:MAG: hypothetical protein KGI54_13585 [Pseudomonadota bacterium]|nr:hypothetical protein [Pseudomonadota bacterium]